MNEFHYPDHRFRSGYVYPPSLPSLAHSELGRGICPRPSIDEALFGRTRTHKLGTFNGGAYSPGSSLIHWGRPGVSIICSLGSSWPKQKLQLASHDSVTGVSPFPTHQAINWFPLRRVEELGRPLLNQIHRRCYLLGICHHDLDWPWDGCISASLGSTIQPRRRSMTSPRLP